MDVITSCIFILKLLIIDFYHIAKNELQKIFLNKFLQLFILLVGIACHSFHMEARG